MLIVPSENIRKYVAYSVEDGGWIHDPNMPGELVEEFEKFKKKVEAEVESVEEKVDDFKDSAQEKVEDFKDSIEDKVNEVKENRSR